MAHNDQGWSGEPYSILGNPEDLERKDDQYLGHYLFKNQQQPPLIVAAAKGAWMTDVHGKRYLDGMSGLWCVNVGYGRQELAEAACRQMLQMSYYPLSQSHIPAIPIATSLFPVIERIMAVPSARWRRPGSRAGRPHTSRWLQAFSMFLLPTATADRTA